MCPIKKSAFHQMGIPVHPAVFNHPPVSAAIESQNSTSKSTNHHVFPTCQPPFAHLLTSRKSTLHFYRRPPPFQVCLCLLFSRILLHMLQQVLQHHLALLKCGNYGQYSCYKWVPTSTSKPSSEHGSHCCSHGCSCYCLVGRDRLSPMCYPLHPGFTWPPPSTNTPFISLTQIQPANGEKQGNNFQNPGSQVQQADQESYNCSIQQPIPHQHHHQLQATAKM